MPESGAPLVEIDPVAARSTGTTLKMPPSRITVPPLGARADCSRSSAAALEIGCVVWTVMVPLRRGSTM